MSFETHPIRMPGSSQAGGLLGRRIRVTVVKGADRGLTRDFAQPKVVIGRSAQADVTLSDPTVSQYHVELWPEPGAIGVRDLDSRNGVRIGEVTVKEGLCASVCTLCIGMTELRIESTGEFVVPESAKSSFGAIVGGAAPMRRLYAMLERLAGTDLSLLIQGESGTGKEMIAHAIHEASPRHKGPFLPLDCTAIPPTLGPSILFGNVRGAYTGADRDRQGVFEAANGGTLFIDEVSELPAEQQAQLLRVLQERQVVRVGDTRPIRVNVRTLCATWRDLRAEVNAGRFREDLYYRLVGGTVWLPSLADRREDIPLLVRHLLLRIPSDVRAARGITEEALAALSQRRFPGNVRELKNTIERLAYLADGPLITSADLAFERLLDAAPGPPENGDDDGADPKAGKLDAAPRSNLEPFKEAKQTLIDEFEAQYLRRLMVRVGQNLSKAAAIAGVERQNLRILLRKHGLYTKK